MSVILRSLVVLIAAGLAPLGIHGLEKAADSDSPGGSARPARVVASADSDADSDAEETGVDGIEPPEPPEPTPTPDPPGPEPTPSPSPPPAPTATPEATPRPIPPPGETPLPTPPPAPTPGEPPVPSPTPGASPTPMPDPPAEPLAVDVVTEEPSANPDTPATDTQTSDTPATDASTGAEPASEMATEAPAERPANPDAPRTDATGIEAAPTTPTAPSATGPESPATGAEPVASLAPATEELLRRMDNRHEDIQTVAGTFTQRKVSEIFLEEIESTGEFWYQKPDKFRADYNPPDEMTNLIVADAVYVYVPEIEQVEIYRFNTAEEREQQLHAMVLGFGFDPERLAAQYEIASSEADPDLRAELEAAGLDPEQSALLRLVPRPDLMDSSPFTSLKLWIDKNRWLPEKIWFEDYNGDQTTIDIQQIALGEPIEPSLFQPNFPAGTEFIDKTQY